jgi:hypothetical protein
MRSFIEKTFDDFIKKNFEGHEEVIKFLIRHERKNLCISNLDKEIYKLEYTHIRLDLAKLTEVINSFAHMFAKTALLCKEQELASYTEKMRLEREYRANQELKEELERDANDNPANIEQLDTEANRV